MKDMFTSLKGFQIVLQALTLFVSFLVYSNDVVEGPVKEIRYLEGVLIQVGLTLFVYKLNS